MADTAPVVRTPLTEDQLRNWKLLECFQERLQPLLDRRPQTPTESVPRRTLWPAQYLSLMLLGLVNPVLKRARALCLASAFERVQQETGGPVGRRVRVQSDGHTLFIVYQSPQVGGPMDGVDLSLPLADRTLFQMA